MERFTYLGSVISNNATVSKHLYNRLSKASSSFRKLLDYGRVIRSAFPQRSRYTEPSSFPPPVRCRNLGSLLEADQATGAVSLTLLALHSWHQMTRPRVSRRSPQKGQYSQHRVHLASVAAVLDCPRHKNGRRIHAKAVFFSEFQEGSWCSKKAFQRPAEEIPCTGGNQPSDMAAGNLRLRQLALICEKAICKFEAERHEAAKEKRRRQKE